MITHSSDPRLPNVVHVEVTELLEASAAADLLARIPRLIAEEGKKKVVLRVVASVRSDCIPHMCQLMNIVRGNEADLLLVEPPSALEAHGWIYSHIPGLQLFENVEAAVASLQ